MTQITCHQHCTQPLVTLSTATLSVKLLSSTTMAAKVMDLASVEEAAAILSHQVLLKISNSRQLEHYLVASFPMVSSTIRNVAASSLQRIIQITQWNLLNSKCTASKRQDLSLHAFAKSCVNSDYSGAPKRCSWSKSIRTRLTWWKSNYRTMHTFGTRWLSQRNVSQSSSKSSYLLSSHSLLLRR